MDEADEGGDTEEREEERGEGITETEEMIPRTMPTASMMRRRDETGSRRRLVTRTITQITLL